MKSLFTKLIVATFFLTISISASAQWYVGGLIGCSYSKSPSTDSKSWAVSFNPETGYVYNEKWTFGGCMEYGKAVSVVDSKYLYEEDIEVNLFKINPYALYTPIRYQNFALCAEIGLEFVPRQSGIDCAMYGAYIKPLLTYSLNENLLLKTELDFAVFSIAGSSSGDFSIGAVAGISDVISLDDDLSIGFIYLF